MLRNVSPPAQRKRTSSASATFEPQRPPLEEGGRAFDQFLRAQQDRLCLLLVGERLFEGHGRRPIETDLDESMRYRCSRSQDRGDRSSDLIDLLGSDDPCRHADRQCLSAGTTRPVNAISRARDLAGRGHVRTADRFPEYNVLDPAHAPGTGTPGPNGLTPRELPHPCVDSARRPTWLSWSWSSSPLSSIPPTRPRRSPTDASG